ncbi:BTB/POZ domain-containing protein 2-like [Mytilus edulis]|uniref:BTB/POZ domain-containing protein 2-like n=1 Tax=Mytilus edulis TaxID=6550 RepID=UPI0039F04247
MSDIKVTFRNSVAAFDYVELEKGPTVCADWRRNKTLEERHLYMFHNQICCDVSLIVGENTNTTERIDAHSFILASGGSVFEKILTEVTQQNTTINIPDIKPKIFRIVLEYLYSEKAEIAPNTISAVLNAAKKFKIYKLIDECFSLLQGYINDDSVCALLEQAVRFQNERLMGKCLRYIDKETASVIKTKSFKQVSLENILKIVSRDSLIIREDDLFDGLLEWAYAKCQTLSQPKTPQNARKMLGEAFYYIRFPMMNPQNFTNKIANISMLTDSEKIDLFRYFYGSEKPNLPFLDRPRQWNKRASGILFNKPHPDIFTQGNFGSNMF